MSDNKSWENVRVNSNWIEQFVSTPVKKSEVVEVTEKWVLMLRVSLEGFTWVTTDIFFSFSIHKNITKDLDFATKFSTEHEANEAKRMLGLDDRFKAVAVIDDI